MDPIDGYWVELAELGERERLAWGNGGNSTMSTCTYAATRYVFKEYSEEFRSVVDQNALGRLIRWRDTLPDEDRKHLDRIAAWPRYRIRHNSVLLGVLLPFAPERFFHQTYPDGQYLPNVIANLVRRTTSESVIPGAPVHVKTSALGNAADVLLWFHRQGVLVNDLRELNILCTELGAAAYFVDCDVMIGPWGTAAPPAAPEYLRELLPADARPSREIELTRLAWVSVWILLDDFSLRDIPQARLTTIIDARDAELITRTGNRQPVDMENWRRLASRWIRWTARVRVGPPPGEPRVGMSKPWLLPPTRKMPAPPPHSTAGWVPEPYRRPLVPVPAAPSSTLLPQPMKPQRHGRTVLLVTAAILLLLGLATLTLMYGGPQ